MNIVDIRNIDFKQNIRTNFKVMVSAIAFFCLNFTYLTKEKFLGLITSCVLILILCAVFPPYNEFTKKQHKSIKVISFLSALGITLSNRTVFYDFWIFSPIIKKINSLFCFDFDAALIISILGSIAALLFIYLLTLFLLSEVYKIIKDTNLIKTLSISEIAFYLAIIIFYAAFIILVFLRTDAFYGKELSFDVIYTSDSSSLMNNNVYMNIYHSENDIRQPLFALFAAPFLGIWYLLGSVLFNSDIAKAVLMDIGQFILLFFSNFLICKMVCKNSKQRIALMLLISCTYTTVLFSLMIEQYIVTFFWLVLATYRIIQNKEDKITLYGASGTLLTSGLLFPISAFVISTDAKSVIVRVFKIGIGFILLLIASGRLDVILNAISQLKTLSSFGGNSLTFVDKIIQYTFFLRNLFLGPMAGVYTNALGNVSWQLDTPESLSVLGLCVIALCILSCIINKKIDIVKFSTLWAIYSFILLVIIGWGTNENGLILYSLYFGWPYIVLIYHLFLNLENKFKVKDLSIVICIFIAIILIVYNYKYIYDMINFASSFYPVY